MFDPAPEHALRIFDGGRREPRAGGVIYWMRVAMRAHENPALDVALAAAAARDVPLLVYQGLSERYPYASDRHHAFILEGARDVAQALAARGIAYVFHLERPGARTPVLRALAADAGLIVTERMPVAPFDTWTAALRGAKDAPPVWEVDASCVAPLGLLDRAPTRAFAFRDATRRAVEQTLASPYQERPEVPRPWSATLPFTPIAFDDVDLFELLAHTDIDHGVAPVPDTRGGTQAGLARWRAYVGAGYRRYAATRNDPLADSTSRMSPYLHLGQVSPFTIARDLHADRKNTHAQKLLDELLVWREVAWHLCHHRPDHATLAALPDWARSTLAEHARDPRPARPSWESLAAGETGDVLWDAAQRSLRVHGELHNNVRMTWGKKLLEWSASPAEALARLLDLNHRFALDGRDPASLGGILWCLGALDRPFPPARPIHGLVRPRPTEAHAQRLDVAAYARFVARPAFARAPRVAVVGAGLAGLAAARTLSAQGVEVVLVDRGQRPGGRVSEKDWPGEARGFDAGPLDFGARSPAFRELVGSWADDGLVRALEGPRVVVDGEGRTLEVIARTEPRFVFAPGARAVVAHAARGLVLHSGVEITALHRDGARWTLVTGDRELGPFDQVLLTMPGPQALRIAGLPAALKDTLARAVYAPTFVVGAETADAGAAELLEVAGGPLERVLNQSLRGGSPRVWVGYATAAESALALARPEAETLETLGAALLGVRGGSAIRVRLHRWTFARVTQAIGPSHAYDGALGLGAAGDGFLGPRVEAAWTSGVALAGALLRGLAHDPAPPRAPRVDLEGSGSSGA